MASQTVSSAARRDLLVGGAWRPSAGQTSVIYPYTGEIVASVANAGPADVEDAIAAAVDAFAVTRRLPAYKRAGILQRAAALIEERGEELARQIVLESGNPIGETRGEVARTVTIFQIAAEEAKRIGGEIIPLDVAPAGERRLGEIRRFPIGPVAGITAYNAPLLLPAHKIAPAFAAGNPVIIKPAPRTPLSALSLGEILLEAGMPPSALSVLPCDVATAEPLVTDERLKALSFTGSVPVGWALKARANRKRVTLELGGNGAVIVHHDADLEWAAARCATGGFLRAGQACIAVQRIYVQQDVYEPFLALLLAHVRAIKMGDPLDPATTMGPLIDEEAARRAERWVDEAAGAGATVRAGGQRQGPFLAPTVLTEVTNQMKVSCEEVFAPVVIVTPYTTFDQALAWTNATPYGLQAGVFCHDLRLVYRAFEELEVGGLIVNDINSWRVDSMPYGGVKASGFGREGLRSAIEELTEPRLLVLKL
ncbi:MAG TPA: aldehyde dehydrogenase family protein [Chloroflexota bacterium]|nr:aldehyde dehydrogenase family protein [Chloroflexota bacterium]